MPLAHKPMLTAISEDSGSIQLSLRVTVPVGWGQVCLPAQPRTGCVQHQCQAPGSDKT